MIRAILEWLTANSATFDKIFGGAIVVLGGLLIYIITKGGIRAVQEWLSTIDEKAKREAMKSMDAALERDRPRSEATRDLVAGLDQWGQVHADQRSRMESVTSCKWLLLGLIPGASILWLVAPSGSVTGALSYAAWFVALGLFLRSFVPLLLLAVHHGMPAKKKVRIGKKEERREEKKEADEEETKGVEGEKPQRKGKK